MKFLKSLGAVNSILVFGLAWSGLGICHAGPSLDSKPRGATEAIERVGYLQVFSATEQHQNGEDTYSYPHTDYGIYNSAGKRIHWISNGGPTDEQPTKVRLQEGKYVIWAWSDYSSGMVHIPVVIKTGSELKLYLEKSSRKPAHNAKVVRLPSGEVIGYAAN